MGGCERRKVEYDWDALEKVLRIRGLTVDDVEDVYETTGVQKMCLNGPTSNSYVVHQLYTAHVDIESIVRALDTVLLRQTILRTTMFDNNNRQVVFRYSPKLRDEIISIHPSQGAPSIQSISGSAGHCVFSPPDNLVHFDVHKTTPVTVLYHVQHALLDAWSRDCLFREIESVIKELPLPDPVPFRNFIDYAVMEMNRAVSITWFTDRFSDLDAIPFPVCDEPSTFITRSVLGQDIECEGSSRFNEKSLFGEIC